MTTTVVCQCGCGERIPAINKKGKPARFKHGHNDAGKATRFKRGDREQAMKGVDARRRLGKLSGEGHWKWNGGEWYVGGGYVRVTLPDGSNIPRSHAVWNAAYPDDPVQPGEHVHHKNGMRDDDRVENLRKIAAREHLSHHARSNPQPHGSDGRFVPR